MSEPPELTARHVNTALKEARRWASNAREKEDMEGDCHPRPGALPGVPGTLPAPPAARIHYRVLRIPRLARVQAGPSPRHMQADNRLMRGAGKTIPRPWTLLVRGRKGRILRDRLAV
jgi:hypothetical protein